MSATESDRSRNLTPLSARKTRSGLMRSSSLLGVAALIGVAGPGTNAFAACQQTGSPTYQLCAGVITTSPPSDNGLSMVNATVQVPISFSGTGATTSYVDNNPSGQSTFASSVFIFAPANLNTTLPSASGIAGTYNSVLSLTANGSLTASILSPFSAKGVQLNNISGNGATTLAFAGSSNAGSNTALSIYSAAGGATVGLAASSALTGGAGLSVSSVSSTTVNAFGLINASGTAISASASSGTLSIVAGNTSSITGTSAINARATNANVFVSTQGANTLSGAIDVSVYGQINTASLAGVQVEQTNSGSNSAVTVNSYADLYSPAGINVIQQGSGNVAVSAPSSSNEIDVAGYGIHTSATSGFTSITSSGQISAGQDAIRAVSDTGGIFIYSTGATTSGDTAVTAVRTALSGSGSVNVTTGDLAAVGAGVVATNSGGTGSLSVTVNGNITPQSPNSLVAGITASNYASGTTDVALNGNIGNGDGDRANAYGILARNAVNNNSALTVSLGNASIYSAANSGGGIEGGVLAIAEGTGSVTIKGTGSGLIAVERSTLSSSTAAVLAGITNSGSSAGVTVDLAQSVIANNVQYGILAGNEGQGNVTVNTHGSISVFGGGNGESAIAAYTSQVGGSIVINSDANTQFYSSGVGVQATNNSLFGSTSLTLGSDIAAQNQAVLVNTNGLGSATVATSGFINSSSSSGIEVNHNGPFTSGNIGVTVNSPSLTAATNGVITSLGASNGTATVVVNGSINAGDVGVNMLAAGGSNFLAVTSGGSIYLNGTGTNQQGVLQSATSSGRNTVNNAGIINAAPGVVGVEQNAIGTATDSVFNAGLILGGSAQGVLQNVVNGTASFGGFDGTVVGTTVGLEMNSQRGDIFVNGSNFIYGLDGIGARLTQTGNTAGNINLQTVGGGIYANVDGIAATSDGTGAIVLDSGGDAFGYNGNGITATLTRATPGAGRIEVNTAQGTTTSGNVTGIRADAASAIGGISMNIAGNVSGANGYGILATSNTTDLNNVGITIEQASSSAITGTLGGVRAEVSGLSGAITINTQGSVAVANGFANAAVSARNVALTGDQVNVVTNIIAASGADGINVVRSNANGAVNITANGSITSDLVFGNLNTLQNGIVAITDRGSAAPITITLNSNIGTSADRAQLVGILANASTNAGGDIAVSLDNDVGTASIYSVGNGITVNQRGSGAVSVAGTGALGGAIDSSAGAGVFVRAAGNGPIRVELPQAVTASGGAGIDLRTTGNSSMFVHAINRVSGSTDGVAMVNNGPVGNIGPITVLQERGAAIQGGSGDGIKTQANASIGGTIITTYDAVGTTTGSGINASSNSARGDITITQALGSSISGGANAISAAVTGTGGNLNITSFGPLSASAGNGVLATNSSNALADGITISTQTINASGGDGINATRTGGAGAINITSNGLIASGAGGPGTLRSGIIATNNAGGNVNVTLNADIGTANDAADQSGVVATQGKSGAAGNIAIALGNQNVFANNGIGVAAVQYGVGNLAITETGAGTISATNGRGVLAQVINGGPANISLALSHDIISGGDGLSALTDGTGNIAITQTGRVTTSTGAGIVAINSRGAPSTSAITISAQDVTAGSTAIRADAGLATGGIVINANGNLASNTGSAIFANSNSTAGSITVTTTAGKTLTANFNGIDAQALGTGGKVLINSNATIDAGNNGIYVLNDSVNASDTTTINSNGAILAGNLGIYALARNQAGDLLINSNATITAQAADLGNGGIVGISNSPTGAVSINVADKADISGFAYGIYGITFGSGDTAITLGQANITTQYAGIYGLSYGLGGVSITDTGAGTITATEGVGVLGLVINNQNTSDLRVDLRHSIASSTGVVLANAGSGAINAKLTGMITATNGDGVSIGTSGSGNVTVTATGGVQATNGYGIYVDNSSGSAPVGGKPSAYLLTTGAVSATQDAIYSANFGTGGTVIAANGNLASTTGRGINASSQSTAGTIAITTAAGTSINAGSDGIAAAVNADSGALSILSNSVITAGASGVLATNNSASASDALTVTSNGAISAVNAGISATRNNAAGDLTVISNGAIGPMTGMAGSLGNGIEAIHNAGGKVSVTVGNGADIIGTSGQAILAQQNATNGSGAVLVSLGAADIDSLGSGIIVDQRGLGATTISDTAAGFITAQNGPAVQASNSNADSAGAISIALQHDLQGTSGVVASNAGTGNIGIATSGTVNATSGNGLSAITYGGGNVTVLATKAITAVGTTGPILQIGRILAPAPANGYGILVVNAATVTNPGAISVTSAAIDATLDAIRVDAGMGTGGTTISSLGDLVSHTANGINASSASTNGAITISAANGMSITADNSGIVAQAYGNGAIGITSGAAIAALVDGIDVASASANAADAVTIKSDGPIAAGNYGIHAVRTNAEGAISITSNGAIGTNALASTNLQTGILAQNMGGGAIAVTLGDGADVGAADVTGIDAQQFGQNGLGDVTISLGAADVAGGSGYGIRATNAGLGKIAITDTAGGAISATTGTGVFAAIGNAASTSGITVNLQHDISSANGLAAVNGGSGAIGLTTGGLVTATNGNGIAANAMGGGSINLTAGGTVTATGGAGIVAVNSAQVAGNGAIAIDAMDVSATGDAIYTDAGLGTGGLAINARGNLTSLTGMGIEAMSSGSAGGITITTAAGKAINAATNGISAQVLGTGGAVAVTNGSTITAGGNGIVVQSASLLAGDAISVTSTGAIAVGSAAAPAYGIFASQTAGAGAVQITSAAAITPLAAGSLLTGIQARSLGGDIAVTVADAADIGQANLTGIDANQAATNGSGSITIKLGAANVAGGTGAGVNAINAGTGSTSLTDTGAGTISATTGTGVNVAITSAASAGSIGVDLRHQITGANGVVATNAGTGSTTLTTAGLVTATNGNGITADAMGGGSINLTAGGTVTATGGAGIVAVNSAQVAGNGAIAIDAMDVSATGDAIYADAGLGTGGLAINARGNLTSLTGMGIEAMSSGSAGGITITTAAGKAINAATNGISAQVLGTGGAVAVTNGSTITAGGNGIVVQSASLLAGDAISVTSTGAIAVGSAAAPAYGIFASQTAGAGAVQITSAAAITPLAAGSLLTGIQARSLGGDIAVTVADAADIGQSNLTGIDANQAATNGTGSITIKLGAANVAGGTGAGVNAINAGTGSVSLTDTGAGTISATTGTGVNVAITSAASAGSIGVDLRHQITGANGVVATNAGTGSTTLTTAGLVTATNGNGIAANAMGGGSINLTAGGTVTATGGAGIVAVNSAQVAGNGAIAIDAMDVSATGDAIYADAGLGTGGLAINARGNLTSLTGMGIEAMSSGSAGGITITTAAGKAINAATNGISAQVLGTGGAVAVTNGSTITAGGNGIVVQSASLLAGDAISVTSTGAIAVGSAAAPAYGIFASQTAGAGAVQITSAAAITPLAAGSLLTGIQARSLGGDIAVTVADAADIGQSNLTGIDANQAATNGSGSITIKLGAANVAGGTGAGVNAINAGTGSVSLTDTGAGTISATTGTGVNVAITSAASAGSIGVDLRHQITGANGVVATNAGTGSTTLTTAGLVTATNGNGIAANAMGGGSINLTAGGTVTATGGAGIVAVNSAQVANAGNITINTAADQTVRANGGNGIVTDLGLSSGSALVSINGKVIAPGFTGVKQVSTNGANLVVVSTSGNIDPVIGVSQSTVDGSNGVQNAGLITGDTMGVRQVASAAGSNAIDNTGKIVGTANQGVFSSVVDGSATFGGNGGSVTGGSAGVALYSSGQGSLTVSGSNTITGNTLGTGAGTVGAGVVLRQTGGTSAGITLATTGGAISGTSGIVASSNGASAISLAPGAGVTATAADGFGIAALSRGGSISITPASFVTSAGRGISASTTANGTVAVKTVGLVSANTAGIVTSADAGATTIVTGPVSVSGSNAIGIAATAETGDISVVSGAVNGVAGSMRSAIRTSGAGNTSITLGAGSTSATNAASGAVIDARGTAAGKLLTINTSAGPIFGATGIAANSDGGFAITAANVNATGSAFVLSGKGSGTVVSNGTVVSGGPAAVIGTGTGVVLTNNGSMTTTGGINANLIVGNTAGNVAIVNNGLMVGNILLNPAASNSLTIAAGATFINGGTLVLGNCATCTWTNNGTLNPGGVGNIQITNMTANFVQSAGARLLADYAPLSNTADLLRVSGTARLAGVVAVNLIGPQTTAAGTRSTTIVSAAGGATLGAATLTGLQNTAARTYSLTQPSATTIAITSVVNYAPVGLTANQAAVGAAVNVASNQASFAAPAAALVIAPTVASLGAGLDTLTGEGITAVQQAAFTRTSRFHETLGHQMRQYATADGVTPVQGWQTWGSFDAGEAATSSQLNAAGSATARFRNRGITAGIGHSVGSAGSAGIAFSVGSTDLRVADRATTGKVDAVEVGGYAGIGAATGAYLQVSGSYASFKNKTNRSINIAGAPNFSAMVAGAFDSNAVSGRVEAGYRFVANSVEFSPFAGLGYSDLSLKGFSETGSAAVGLNVLAQKAKSMPGWLGMQINSAPSATTRVTYWLRGALQHEFEPARNMTASLAAAPGTKFIVVGAQPGENSAKVSGGFDVKVGRSVSLFGAVDALLGKTPASYNGQVGARIRF